MRRDSRFCEGRWFAQLRQTASCRTRREQRPIRCRSRCKFRHFPGTDRAPASLYDYPRSFGLRPLPLGPGLRRAPRQSWRARPDAASHGARRRAIRRRRTQRPTRRRSSHMGSLAHAAGMTWAKRPQDPGSCHAARSDASSRRARARVMRLSAARVATVPGQGEDDVRFTLLCKTGTNGRAASLRVAAQGVKTCSVTFGPWCCWPHALALVACGGSADATVSGTLSGPASGRPTTLQDNGASSLTLTRQFRTHCPLHMTV
jgi:hypothetical protein